MRLTQYQEKLKQYQQKDKLSILNRAKYSPLGIFQNYLVLIEAKTYIKYFKGNTRIYSWSSDGMSGEDIESMQFGTNIF